MSPRSFHLPLNPEQASAVSHSDGPLLVLAGAGAGKTRIVTARIAHLIERGVDPEHILAVTFTNKAAREMQERVEKLSSHWVWVSTFHSLGAAILRERVEHIPGKEKGFVIYDEEDSLKCLRHCCERLQIKQSVAKPKTFRKLISDAKNSLQAPHELPEEGGSSEAKRLLPEVYRLYEKELTLSNAVDFDDLLFLPVRLLKEDPETLAAYHRRWCYLLIDEYQDTNQAQYELARLLSGELCNLFAVGDPDQSIYSWRGANLSNILNFEEDYPGAKIIRLEQNYRSTNQILKASNALIRHNEGRYQKELWSTLGEGDKIQCVHLYDAQEEAQFLAQTVETHWKEGVSLNEMVLFYRTHAQSRPLEDALLQQRIPYRIVGGISFYQRREVKDILAYLRMILSGRDVGSFARTLNIPKRGVGDTSLEKLRLGSQREDLPILAYCRALLQGEIVDPSIRLTQRQRQGLTDYLTLIDTLKQRMEEEILLHELVTETISLSGYLNYLKEDPESAEERKSNLDALISKAAEWEEEAASSLPSFLEELTLKSHIEEGVKEEEKLNLMTLHNGKGLEFTLTFLTGMEEGVFPHINSIGDQDRLEEERRLCYVGMTRAKQLLYLTHTSHRFVRGNFQAMRASRFLREIPPHYLSKGSSSTPSLRPQRERNRAPHSPALPPSSSLAAGQEVHHKTFGKGVILSTEEGPFGKMIRVHFSQDQSERTLVERFANLSVL